MTTNTESTKADERMTPPYRIYGEWGVALVGNEKQLREMEVASELLAMLRSLANGELTIDRGYNRTPSRLALREEVWNLIFKAEGK